MISFAGGLPVKSWDLRLKMFDGETKRMSQGNDLKMEVATAGQQQKVAWFERCMLQVDDAVGPCDTS